ncbi:MAG: two-CW domain-containing protein [Candidatus Sedimenticola sp. PURPLELP]
MKSPVNCWEFFKCGREPGGDNARSLGICPTATQQQSDGINKGKAAGRVCWSVNHSHCIQSIGEKFTKCLQCPFFHKVQDEEGRNFRLELGIDKD